MSSFGLATQSAIECFNENRWGNGQIEAKNAGEINKKLEQKKSKMHEQFSELDQRLQGKTYVCDDQDISGITVADYALGCQAMDLVLFGDNFDSYPNIKKWLGHLLNADGQFAAIHDELLLALSQHDEVYPYYEQEPLEMPLDLSS